MSRGCPRVGRRIVEDVPDDRATAGEQGLSLALGVLMGEVLR